MRPRTRFGIDSSTVVRSPHLTVGPSFSTTVLTADKNAASSENEDDEVYYQELQWLSREIQRHDELYYRQQPELTDDEFDALVLRELTLSETYPHLLQRWQEESGLGEQATRHGRVGVVMADGEVSNSTVVVITAQQQQQQPPLEPRLKRKHLAPMLSLENVYNDEQLWAWLKRIPKVLDEVPEGTTTKVTIYTEPKLDGVSLSLRYRKQPSSSSSTSTYELEWASTRGDGQNGQDVTFAVRSMNQTIPALLTTRLSSLPDTIEIRGEVVLPNSEFDKISQLMPNISFSNPRNAASGILLRKETEEEVAQTEAVQLRCKLQFYAYDMVVGEALDLDGNEVQHHLEQMGFSIPSPVTETVLNLSHSETMDEWSNDSISPMLSFYQALQAHRGGGGNSQTTNKHSTQGYDWGDFEMDGCVHKVSQFQLRQLLGRSMKSPKWAVAHKFSPQAVVTKLLNVTVQVGRTGALTPVAILDPVDIGGVTIQRATLHNFGHLQQVLGGTTMAVGTSVLVRRAGDVIPQVVQRIGIAQASKGDEGMISLEAPKHCPACSSPVVLDEIMSSGVGQVLRCGGPPLLCPPRAVTSLAHAFSRDAMDITGLSEARIQQLMDADLLRLPSDIYRLGDEGWAKIQELPGWGSKSCQNLRSAADRVSTTGVSLSRFIYSLGIRHLGKGSSELVASCYVTNDAFMAALDHASKEIDPVDDGYVEPGDQPFSVLHGQLGVGPVLIQSLVNFSKSRELVDAAKALSQAVRVLDVETIAEERSKAEPASADGTQLPWKGLRVVFTGSIPDYSRTEAQKLAKRLGAKSTPESVSKSTDLVIFGDKGGRKLEAARSLGIRTMIAEEFVRLVDETLKDGR